LDRHRQVALAPVALALMLTACGHHAGSAAHSGRQDNFGVQMARLNLWREAMFRFQRAVDLDPGDAMAHNNLAVAYEANGDFEKARREYLEALKLDRNNTYIQKNYSRYVEFLSRNKKRQQARPATATATPVLPKPGATGTIGNNYPPGTPEGAKPVSVPPPPAKPSDQPEPQPGTQPTPPQPTPPAKPPADYSRRAEARRSTLTQGDLSFR
jgi:tetratricopeptide (TPR) repeat protein